MKNSTIAQVIIAFCSWAFGVVCGGVVIVAGLLAVNDRPDSRQAGTIPSKADSREDQQLRSIANSSDWPTVAAFEPTGADYGERVFFCSVADAKQRRNEWAAWCDKSGFVIAQVEFAVDNWLASESGMPLDAVISHPTLGASYRIVAVNAYGEGVYVVFRFVGQLPVEWREGGE